MNKENTKTLAEKRESVLAEMKLYADKVEKENRNLTPEENTSLSDLDRMQDELFAKIETLSKVEHVNSLTSEETRNKIISSPYHQGAKPFASVEERQKAMAGWMYHGTPKSKPEFWRAAERAGIDVNSPQLRIECAPWEEYRGTSNQVEGTANLGGDVVFPDLSFARNIDVALKHYGDIFKTSTIIDTQTGSALPYPLMDDTGTVGEVTAEAGAPNVKDMTFAQNTLHAYKYDSGFVKVSWELMQDSVIPLADFVAKAAGQRMGRIINADIIATGGGATEIQNILDGMTLGKASTSSESAGPIYTDLVGLVESIDYAYQSEPGCGFLFSQDFRAKLRSILDGNDRPLLMSSLEGIALGIPNSLLGYPYYVNAAVPTWGHTGSGTGAAGKKVAIFGDLKKILIRRVTGGEGGYNLVRLNELYAANGLVAFLVWGRFDAILSDAGTHPVKYLESPAS